MFDRILVPTDGSDAARHVADHGIELAMLADAELHVLYVLKTEFPLEKHTQELEQKQKEAATEIVEDIAGQARSNGLEAATRIKQGVPYRQILSYADSANVDLIVMGTHGRTGVNRYLLGSTTEKVVRLADREVLTAHPFDDS